MKIKVISDAFFAPIRVEKDPRSQTPCGLSRHPTQAENRTERLGSVADRGRSEPAREATSGEECPRREGCPRRPASADFHLHAGRRISYARVAPGLQTDRKTQTRPNRVEESDTQEKLMSLIEERQRRILTTHVGSLPRPQSLSAKLFARMTGASYDQKALADELHRAVGGIVKTQVELGVDVVSDGELSKTSFQYYVTDRLAGSNRSRRNPACGQRGKTARSRRSTRTARIPAPSRPETPAPGRSSMSDTKQLEADIANLKAALKGASPVDVFMPSVSPSSCVGLMENRHYASEDEHLYAVAEALREEYQAIVAAGFIVQIDDPRLAMNYMLNPETKGRAAARLGGQRIAALNHALRDIPPERVRHHTCYGINMGPRTSDFELKHLADLIVTIRAGSYSFEWRTPAMSTSGGCGKTVKLPEGKVLMPGASRMLP